MKKFSFINGKLLSKLNETTTSYGSKKSTTNGNFELCRLPLEKGYKYRVWGSVAQDCQGKGLNCNVNVENCKLIYELIRGTALNGGGTFFEGNIEQVGDDAEVILGTYSFDSNATYYGNLHVSIAGFENLSQ